MKDRSKKKNVSPLEVSWSPLDLSDVSKHHIKFLSTMVLFLQDPFNGEPVAGTKEEMADVFGIFKNPKDRKLKFVAPFLHGDKHTGIHCDGRNDIGGYITHDEWLSNKVMIDVCLLKLNSVATKMEDALACDTHQCEFNHPSDIYHHVTTANLIGIPDMLQHEILVHFFSKRKLAYAYFEIDKLLFERWCNFKEIAKSVAVKGVQVVGFPMV